MSERIRKHGAVLGSLLFFILAPGTVAGWLPYVISGWRVEAPFFGIVAGRIAGGVLVIMGVLSLAHCFARFALDGLGTPAPIAPTESLVVSGLYRYVRNPMYLAVACIIVGQGVLLGSAALVGYAGAVWFSFHVFVLAYEEPTLQRRYGDSYEVFRTHVNRWLPRMTPWPGMCDRSVA